jgi:hypothetical protein
LQPSHLGGNVVFDQEHEHTVKQDSNKFLSGQPIIVQLISMIPGSIFDQAIAHTQADRYYKQMKAKDHFICLFYAVLTRNSSLREVCKNITLIARKLLYVGLKQLPCKSTLSDANRNRDSQFFASIYMGLYLHYKALLKTHWGPIGEEVDPCEVEVFDSTTITLFKDILKGAGRNPIDGKKKGGIKAFTKMNLAEGVPDFICLKAGATNENTFLKVLNLPQGGIAVFDKGFNKYRCFDQWTQHNRFFVTRLKDNAHYQVVEENNTEAFPDVLQDQQIMLKYKDKKVTRTVTLRLITYRDPVSGEILHFLTNLWGHTAMTVALLYKNRWTIEVLFKQIKQNFELKYFLSDSENGIKSQIWVALILNLLFTLLHRRIKEAEDFSTMVMVAAKNLCSYVNLQLFLTHTQQYCQAWYKKESEKVQLEIPWSG